MTIMLFFNPLIGGKQSDLYMGRKIVCERIKKKRKEIPSRNEKKKEKEKEKEKEGERIV